MRTAFEKGDVLKELETTRLEPLQLVYAFDSGFGYLTRERRLPMDEIATIVAAFRKQVGTGYDQEIDKTVEESIDRLVLAHNIHNASDVEQTIRGLELLETLQFPVTETLSRSAECRLEKIMEYKPELTARFCKAFHADQEWTELRSLDQIMNVNVFRQLRRDGCAPLSNDDPRVHTEALDAIRYDVRQRGGKQMRDIQQECAIPDAEFRTAVRQGLLELMSDFTYESSGRAEAWGAKAWGAFDAICSNTGVELPPDDPEVQKHALKGFIQNMETSPSKSLILRLRYHLTPTEDMKKRDEFRIQSNFELENFTEAAIRKEALDLSEEEYRKIFRETFLQHLTTTGSDYTIAPKAIALAASGILPEEELREVVLERVRKDLMNNLHTSDVKFAEACRKTFGLDETRVRELYIDKLQKFLEKGLLHEAIPFKNARGLEKEFSSPRMRNAALTGMYTNLEDGYPEPAIALRDEMHLEEEWQSEEAGKRSLTGICALIMRRDPVKAMEMRREMNTPDRALAGELRKRMSDEDCVPKILEAIPELPDRVLQDLDSDFFLRRYVNDLGLPCTAIYREYVRLQTEHNPVALSGFVTQIHTQMESLLTGKAQDAAITGQPYYRDLIESVFPNNAGNWTSFEKNETCADRSDDLRHLTIREQYAFTVAPGTDMRLKSGREADSGAIETMQQPIERVQSRFGTVGFEPQQMLSMLDQQIAQHSACLSPAEAFTTREERIFGLLLESMTGGVSPEVLPELLIAYQFAEFEDIRAYLEGTRGRAESAKNPQYAYLLELHEFFSDRLKEVSRQIADRAMKNPQLAALLPQYFAVLSQQERQKLDKGAIDRLQIDKLGLAPGWLDQIARTLRKQTGKDYSPDEVCTLVREYEERTEKLADAVPPDASLHPAIYGQIRTQRLKTIQALEMLSGTTVNPGEIFLGEIDLQSLLQNQRDLQSGTYNEKLFAGYLAQSFQGIFRQEVSVIDKELGKYEPAEETANKNAKPKRVEAFITKNHTSAHARATAGVCVSGDNPIKDAEREKYGSGKNLWDNPDFLQMVLRDGTSKICQGCVLLHVEQDGGQKFLTASLNPSSTYLYQVNEREMFENLLKQLIIFAKDNNFDAVAVSQNKQIRTNRTGGEFERAMDERIRTIDQKHTFSTERDFSFKPEYRQQNMDLLWVKETKES